MTTGQNYRYPGARPFAREDKTLFFGREEDIQRMTELVRQEQWLVLYGKSGLGKSSLLEAGVLPLLDADKHGNYSIISLRLGAFDATSPEGKKSPIERVLQRLKTFSTQKTYIDSFHGSLSPLWQALKRLQITRKQSTLLLVFDQFEELFTYSKEDIAAFKRALAEALYEDVPQPIREAWENGAVKLSADEEAQLLMPFQLKCVAAIRSDRMSYLDSLKDAIPDVLRKTYELKPLTRAQAEDAILSPAYLKDPKFAVPPFDYEDELVDNMLYFLSDGGKLGIESAQLQIICQYAERLLAQGAIAAPAQSVPRVRREDLGELAHIYRNYYDNMLAEIPNAEEQLVVRRLIEEDLIFEPDQRRISLYEGIIYRKGISETRLRFLVDAHHILRAEPNMSGGYTYELSHDTLVAPILTAKRARVAVEEEARVAAERLMFEQERIEAENRAKQAEARAKEEQTLRKTAEVNSARARKFGMAAIGGLLIALFAAIFIYFQSGKIRETNTNLEKSLAQNDSILRQLQVKDSLRLAAEGRVQELEAQAKMYEAQGNPEMAAKLRKQAYNSYLGDVAQYTGTSSEVTKVATETVDEISKQLQGLLGTPTSAADLKKRKMEEAAAAEKKRREAEAAAQKERDAEAAEKAAKEKAAADKKAEKMRKEEEKAAAKKAAKMKETDPK